MSLNLNRVTLAGNLTRDPEIRFFANEKAVASFSLAINRKWKDANGEQKEEVTFVDCEAWGRTAELIGQYLMKGAPAYIEGRLRLEVWEDKNDGSKRSKMKVVADTVQFLGQKKDRAAAPEESSAPRAQVAPVTAARARVDDDSEAPF